MPFPVSAQKTNSISIGYGFWIFKFA